MNFSSPKDLDAALELLTLHRCSILSGGTDFFPSLGDAKPTAPIVDISRLTKLAGISEDNDFWTIGALVTWSELIRTPLPAAFDALKQAAREVGSAQIQNRATIVGNLCNASPAADGVPPLLCLDAQLELSSQSGQREVALCDFITGNRETLLRPNELVTKLKIPKLMTNGRSRFVKLGARKYLVISISMVAVRLECDERKIIRDAAVAVGSCSAVAMRMNDLEHDLVGTGLSHDAAAIVGAKHCDCLAPIDDVRATGQYRSDATVELIRRAITGIADEV